MLSDDNILASSSDLDKQNESVGDIDSYFFENTKFLLDDVNFTSRTSFALVTKTKSDIFSQSFSPYDDQFSKTTNVNHSMA